MSKAAFKEHCWGLAFVSPPFIGFCIFMAFPIVFAFVASLTKWNGMNQMLDNFVGLDNYIKLLGEGYVSQNFRKAFRQNFRQSTILWLGLAAVSLLFFLDIRISMALQNTMGRIMLISCSVFLIPFILLALYIFPVQAKFENKIFNNIKNALLMSIRHFFCSLLLLMIYATIVLLAFSFPPFMGLFLCCGIGLTAYLTSNIFIYIFRKYIPLL